MNTTSTESAISIAVSTCTDVASVSNGSPFRGMSLRRSLPSGPVIAGSTALIAFGVDSLIEVLSAVALLWRLLQAGPNATSEEHGHAERRALYLVSATFFLLAAFVIFESISALLTWEAADSSAVGLVLSVLSLIIMPVLAYTKQQTGRELGSKALQADAVETWVCSVLDPARRGGIELRFRVVVG